ncbi:hypothetical protein GIB67_009349 [Kingdonia uniflora]|uniref:MYND-type domain-containing protein n=1 Tax=Kingdonia uniflora TaxID=39325 RepID=A0A7J7N371_9MAGN|nr:hypothetical protein GIB67_009349 [Kingdonia uniflora]
MVTLKELEDGETPSPSEQELNASEGGQRSSTNDTDQKELDDGETPSPSEQELNSNDRGERSSTNDTDQKELDDGETPSPSEQELNSNDRGEQSSTNNADDVPEQLNLFERLPDDIVIDVLCKLSSTAKCPSDFISIRITYKNIYTLSHSSIVLAKASPKTFVRAKNWSESGEKFLKNCVDAGNLEALYTYGMIEFYCLQNKEIGWSFMGRAAKQSHTAALYSLAVILFNQCGAINCRDISVTLCRQAACLGHNNAILQFGHYLIEGYGGITRDTDRGYRLLSIANTRDLNILSSSNNQDGSSGSSGNRGLLEGTRRNLLSNYYRHTVNQFLIEWFRMRQLHPGLSLCANMICGRPETRQNEFRTNCYEVKYCSYSCQTNDWNLRHMAECLPFDVEEGEDVMPEEAEGVMPVEAEDVMPEEAENVMPMEAEDVMPEEAENVMPVEAEDVMPEEAEDVIPEEAENVMPVEA